MISIESMATTKYATQGGMSARSAQAMLSTALWSLHLREAQMGKRTPHGYYKHHLYNTWRGMLGRCKHQSNRLYHNYGGRGISVCDEWQDAATFIKRAFENGWKEGLQIDRIDNDGNYCPGNCRFVTRKQNCRNARHNVMITFGQTTQPLAAWAEQYGLHPKTLNNRIYRYGWTVEQALSLPLRQGKKP